MTGLRILLACQWGCVCLAAVGAWAIGTEAWGLWIPVSAYVFGTATYVWRWAPDAAMHDRNELRELAWGAGWRGGLLVAAGALWALPGAAEGGPDTVVSRVSVSLLLAAGCAAAMTGLTLVGLDGGRSRALDS